MTSDVQVPTIEVPPDGEAQRYERARKRVEDIRGFYVHLSIYLVVNAVVVLIDYASGSGWWFYWVLLGWGVGLGAHAVATFVEGGVLGADWEQRKVRELMARDRR